MESVRKTEVLNRMKSIHGHLRGVLRMVEEDQYCIDIIRQSMAVQRAIDKVNAIVLKNHLETCVARALRQDNADERERVVSELLQLYEGGTSVGLNRHIQPIPVEGVLAEVQSPSATAVEDSDDVVSCPHCGAGKSQVGGAK